MSLILTATGHRARRARPAAALVYLWEGDAGASDYAIDLNIVSLAFKFHAVGLELESYWQGVTCMLCNFNGEEGTGDIVVPRSQTGVLVGLWISNSQFNAGGNQINLGASVVSGAIVGNAISSMTASTDGIVVNGGQLPITGNSFNSDANSSSQTGVVVKLIDQRHDRWQYIQWSR